VTYFTLPVLKSVVQFIQDGSPIWLSSKNTARSGYRQRVLTPCSKGWVSWGQDTNNVGDKN